MPVKQGEAHRALELLEEYHQRLVATEDRQLRQAIERVITIFKSRLFQALLDIQEFYEDTLTNERKSAYQKTLETQKIADRWEANPPILGISTATAASSTNGGGGGYSSTSASRPVYKNTDPLKVPYIDDTPLNRINNNGNNGSSGLAYSGGGGGGGGGMTSTKQYSPQTNDSWQDGNNTTVATDPVRVQPGSASGQQQYSSTTTTTKTFVSTRSNGNSGGGGSDEWEYEDIVLEKGQTGLGFSIAGGSDNPHIGDDPSIYVTKIIPGGAAANDQRLRKDDIILRVNRTDLVNVPHHVSVDALKAAGNVVQLYVKRLRSGSPGLGPPPPPPVAQSSPYTSGVPPQNNGGGSTTPTHHQQQPPIAASYTTTYTREDELTRYKQPSSNNNPITATTTNNVPPHNSNSINNMTAPAAPSTPTNYHHSSPPQQQQQQQQQQNIISYDRPPAYLPNTDGKPSEGITLVKGANMGLGFSIAGGIHNEHLPGDTGIYVTKIIDGGAAQADGRLQVGDKILAVGPKVLHNITHEEAVNVLKSTGERVLLTVVKNPHPELTMSNTSATDPNGGGQQPFSYTAGGSLPRARTPVGVYEPYVPHIRQHQEPPPQQQQQYVPPPQQQPAEPVSHQPPINNTIERGPRRLNLNKGPSGLGFNIVGGEDGEGIFISYILPGGVADLSGLVYKGDQLLEVNNTNLRGATHEDAANALKHSGQNVTLVTQYRPEDYARFEAKIEELRNEMINQGQMPQPSPRKELFVRALFDYDPSKDSDLPSHGLAFRYGDVLHVTNASDDEWWQARRVMPDGTQDYYGIIPSKRRVERKERLRRKQVNFFSGHEASVADRQRGSRTQLSFSRKFPFMKSKERLNEESEMESRTYTSYTSDSDWQEELVLSYEAVEQQQLRYVRPVIVLGPLKDRINNDIISEGPDRFGSCVPHTSRPRRDHEVDGRDYHFVNRDQMEYDIQNKQYIECGQYNNNLYGTNVNSVREVAEQNKHCVLDVSGNAIRRLQAANMYPIAVFVKPYNPNQLMEWNRGRISADEAERNFERFMTMEQEFAESFTAIVQGETPEEITQRVKRVVTEQSTPLVWIPSRDRI